MNLIFHSLDAEGVLELTGSSISVDMLDRGDAQVSLALAVAHGPIFQSTGSTTTPSSALLPPGLHPCAIAISAMNLGVFGSRYRSTVSINGKVVATAEGTVDDVDKAEQDAHFFSIRLA